MKVKEAEAQLSEANEKLTRVRRHVARLRKQLEKLETQFEAAELEKMQVVADAKKTHQSLDLAQRLVGALASENVRWLEGIDRLQKMESVLIGDVLLAAAFVSYAGSFDIGFRSALVDQWTKFIREKQIPISDESDPVSVLVDDAVIASWGNQRLPSDRTSIENGCILTNCERWPLMIDPQLQGITWIKQRYPLVTDPDSDRDAQKLHVVRLGQKGLIDIMERAISNGDVVLVENIGESIDAVLSPIVSRNIIRRGKTSYIRLDNEVTYNPKFRLIFHTKLSNPHYAPETQAETTVRTVQVLFYMYSNIF